MRDILGKLRLKPPSKIARLTWRSFVHTQNLTHLFRSSMNRYAREVHEALEQVGKIENFKRRVNEMQQQEFTTWASFVTTVLQLDHEVIPQGSSVKSRVVNLDSVRQQLTQLWHNESVETRRQIAQALRGLADNVENRR